MCTAVTAITAVTTPVILATYFIRGVALIALSLLLAFAASASDYFSIA
jgi:hypothetical protein